MADFDVHSSPLRKRKVEAFGSSASAPKDMCVSGLRDSESDDEMASDQELYRPIHESDEPRHCKQKVEAFESSPDASEEKCFTGLCSTESESDVEMDPESVCCVEGPPQRMPEEEASGYKSPMSDSEDDDVDLVLAKEYCRQLRESDGFDVGFKFSHSGVFPHACFGTSEDSIDLILYGRLGLHCHNIQKGVNLQLKHLEKYNTRFSSFCHYYITLKAMDPVGDLPYTFQTLVSEFLRGNGEGIRMTIETEICRLKPTTPGFEVSGKWDDGAVDDFYKGDMPNWFPTGGELQDCYELPMQDLPSAGDDGLGLYCQFALHHLVYLRVCGEEAYKSYMPLKLKQVYVQTREDVKPVWKAKNAVFYMSFSPCGSTVEYEAIVRKTMDGQLGHLRLEVKLLGF